MAAIIDDEDIDYVCTLTEKSLAKAKAELNEDPANRLGAVKTFRDWIKIQPHFRCRTDTNTLIRFLRYCKFSQLEARKRLNNYLMGMEKYYEYLGPIDITNLDGMEFLRNGYMIPLPGLDSQGHKVVLCRIGAFDPKTTSKYKLWQGCMALFHYMFRDENTMVNGLVYIADMSNMDVSHQMFWTLEDMRRNMHLLQNCFPARFKGFHYYNLGPVAETLLAMALPLMKKKFRDRITIHGNNMESLYKIFPMEIFPEEYLPDDYSGKNAGTVEELCDRVIKEMQEPETARCIAEMSAYESFGVDESKRPKDEEPSASFRKLNVE